MLLTIFFSLTMWLSQHVLPDNAKYLWRKAYYTWRVSEKKATQGEDLRSVTEIDHDLKNAFRNLATHSIPLVQGQIDNFNTFLRENNNNLDPDVQADVRWHRKHLAIKEANLKWYKMLLDMSDRDPIPLPK